MLMLVLRLLITSGHIILVMWQHAHSLRIKLSYFGSRATKMTTNLISIHINQWEDGKFPIQKCWDKFKFVELHSHKYITYDRRNL